MSLACKQADIHLNNKNAILLKNVRAPKPVFTLRSKKFFIFTCTYKFNFTTLHLTFSLWQRHALQWKLTIEERPNIIG